MELAFYGGLPCPKRHWIRLFIIQVIKYMLIMEMLITNSGSPQDRSDQVSWVT